VDHMGTFHMRAPSPALVVSTIALMLAAGGTSYAAFSLPKNSVGTNQLKKNAVTASKIKNGAVTGSKIGRNTITGQNINVGTLGTVPSAVTAGHASSADRATNATAAATATNAANATHASNADSATNADAAKALGSVAYGFDTSAGAIDVPPCGDNPCTPDQVGSTFAIATCPQGLVAIGGGGETAHSGVELSGSFPLTGSDSTVPNAWQVDVDNWLQTGSKVDYYVVCANAKSVDNPSGV
jgi:hypothetical protein